MLPACYREAPKHKIWSSTQSIQWAMCSSFFAYWTRTWHPFLNCSIARVQNVWSSTSILCEVWCPPICSVLPQSVGFPILNNLAYISRQVIWFCCKLTEILWTETVHVYHRKFYHHSVEIAWDVTRDFLFTWRNPRGDEEQIWHRLHLLTLF